MLAGAAAGTKHASRRRSTTLAAEQPTVEGLAGQILKKLSGQVRAAARQALFSCSAQPGPGR
jgi:hypothetical protein